MNSFYLTPEEKKKALHWLSQSSKGGGWFLLFMGVFVFGLLIFGSYRLISIGGERSLDFIILFSMLGLAFFLPGIWLVRYKNRLARLLDKPMTSATAVVTHIHVIPYAGWQMRLQLNMVDGEQTGAIRVVVKPDWQVGDQIEVLLLGDGRFFPRELNQAVDLGRIHTPDYRERRRRWIGCGTIVFLGLVALAYLLGLYGQGRLG